MHPLLDSAKHLLVLAAIFKLTCCTFSWMPLEYFLLYSGHQMTCWFPLLLSLSAMSITQYWCFRVFGHSVLLSLVVKVVHGFWILLFSYFNIIWDFEKPKTMLQSPLHPLQKPHLCI